MKEENKDSVTATALEGYLPPQHRLSPRGAMATLPAAARHILGYPLETLWMRESSQLPAALRRLRIKARDFSRQHLHPLALELDLAGHGAPGEWQGQALGLVQRAGKAGFLTDMLPAPLGTLSPGAMRHMIWAQAIRTEEYARQCGGLMLLLSAHHLGVAPILLSGDLAAINRFVLPAYRQLKQGIPELFAFAITEPGAGSDAEEGHGAKQYRPQVIATRDKQKGGWRLNGRKCFISGGDVARHITVFAALNGEGMESWTCFLVHSDMPGFKAVRNELKMGMRASGATELEFADLWVPDTHIIGGLRQGWGLNRGTLNFSRLPVAAMAVGFAQSAVDLTQAFVCETHLGGKRLIDYQEVQLQLAQMIAQTSAIRALVWQKAQCFTPRQGDASMSKFYCTDGAVEVVNMAMDLMGHHSLDHCHRIEKVFRDVRLTQIFEGTNQINRLAVIEDSQEELLGQIP